MSTRRFDLSASKGRAKFHRYARSKGNPRWCRGLVQHKTDFMLPPLCFLSILPRHLNWMQSCCAIVWINNKQEGIGLAPEGSLLLAGMGRIFTERLDASEWELCKKSWRVCGDFMSLIYLQSYPLFYLLCRHLYWNRWNQPATLLGKPHQSIAEQHLLHSSALDQSFLKHYSPCMIRRDLPERNYILRVDQIARKKVLVITILTLCLLHTSQEFEQNERTRAYCSQFHSYI